MKNNSCPYCKEEIKPNAIKCKHCHASLHPTRKEMAIAEITERIMLPPPAITKPSGTPCKALCYVKFGSNKVRLNECVDDCEAASAIATVAEKLHRELFETFIEVIWGGGDIDPIPFEKSVREHFSPPPDKP